MTGGLLNTEAFDNTVDIRDLTVRHAGASVPAIDGLSLRISPGECLLLTGASGCGKTTLLQCINGLIPTEISAELHGTVAIGDTDAATLSARDIARRVGMVFQDPRAEFFTFDVRSELAFPCENFAMDPEEIHRRIHRVSDVLNIHELLPCKLSELSSGQRQRVAIAAAMMPEPGVLLFDEPSANLDTEGMSELASVLETLTDHGTAVIVADHRLHYLADVAKRCIILDRGRIGEDLSIAELRTKPRRWFDDRGLQQLDPAAAMQVPITKTNPDRGMQLRDLECSYPGRPPLWQISDLTFPDSGIVGVFGPNGAGKTSMLRVLMGIHRRARGNVRLNGRSRSRRERRRRFAYVMQDVDYQLVAETVVEELIYGYPKTPKVREHAGRLLDEMGLSELRDRHPLTLSGGQKQRLGIALACMKDPEVMCLDEPTSGLDQGNMLRVGQLLRRLADQGMLILVVTHDEQFVQTAVDRAVTFTDGTAAFTPEPASYRKAS